MVSPLDNRKEHILATALLASVCGRPLSLPWIISSPSLLPFLASTLFLPRLYSFLLPSAFLQELLSSLRTCLCGCLSSLLTNPNTFWTCQKGPLNKHADFWFFNILWFKRLWQVCPWPLLNKVSLIAHPISNNTSTDYEVIYNVSGRWICVLCWLLFFMSVPTMSWYCSKPQNDSSYRNKEDSEPESYIQSSFLNIMWS